ncbi:putative L-asparaginase [Besnoitia besnoiti]|uniref:asparaginase n=1 Tax=Besnoitia besnoiti TaxID=94643 RepID=A0A2A9M979_BESBE|nr:putative L-asparaginase [Besnoitia besnoiti]PFH32177.1 putative L-asparaginase [Besnoitia besnoiti]
MDLHAASSASRSSSSPVSGSQPQELDGRSSSVCSAPSVEAGAAASALSASSGAIRGSVSAPRLYEASLAQNHQPPHWNHRPLPRTASGPGSMSQRMTVNEHTVVCLSADVTPLHLSAAITDCGLDVQELKPTRGGGSANACNKSHHASPSSYSRGSCEQDASVAPQVTPYGVGGAPVCCDLRPELPADVEPSCLAPSALFTVQGEVAEASGRGGRALSGAALAGSHRHAQPAQTPAQAADEAGRVLPGAPGEAQPRPADNPQGGGQQGGAAGACPVTTSPVPTAARLFASPNVAATGVRTTLLPDKPLVLIIITGGTICMDYGGEQSSMRPTRLAQRLQDLPELNDPNLPRFDVLEWDSLVDSSEIALPQWKLLAQQVANFYGDYDGFVILHGTDTMAYTAAALSFMLENLGKPVVMTGSMLPMMHISTDAKRNLAVSMMMAGYSQLTELVVIFGSHVLRGTRVSKVDCSRIDAFESPNFPALGSVGVDVVLHDELLLKPPVRGFRIFTRFCLNVAVVPLTPFLPVDRLRRVFEEPKRPFGVVLQLYGSGTAPGTEELLQTIKDGIESGINIVATTQCRRGSANLLAYESGVWLSNLGVINGKDLTLEACVAKLAYLMGKGYTGLPLKDLMEADIRGELTESPNKVAAVSAVLDLADATGSRSKGDDKRELSVSPMTQGVDEKVRLKTQDLGACTLYRHRVECCDRHADFQVPERTGC